MRLGACGIAMILPAIALASPALTEPLPEAMHGVWRIDGGSCRVGAPRVEAPLTIDEWGLHFYETSCTVAEAMPAGIGGALSLRLDCAGEEAEWQSAAMVALDDEDRLLFYWDHGSSFRGERCG